MESVLTLVIALGGIATGIGAIWAALAAKRQAQISERQTQLTEQSLAQTERSLAEQIQTLREQNERARLNLEFDLFTRIEERIENPYWMSTRRAAAKYLLENAFAGDEVLGVTSLNRAVLDSCSLFEEIGELLRLGVLRAETVANRSGVMSEIYWTLCKPAIEKMRQEWGDPALFEDFEYLRGRVVEVDRERDVSALTQESMRQVLENEATLGEEPRPPQSEGG